MHVKFLIICSKVIFYNYVFFPDSYFTEKYLGFPSKHMQEYDNADLTKKAANLKDRRFFLIHSTADTLVTPQHSLMLAKALVNQDILFQQLVSYFFFSVE